MKNGILLAAGTAGFLMLSASVAPNQSQAKLSKVSFENDTAETYCWKNASGRFFCYGPVQRTSYGENEQAALEYAGCKGAAPQSPMPSGHGVCNGRWYVCTSTKSEGWHNSGDKIEGWVDGDQGCN